jgi:hypothetical protein
MVDAVARDTQDTWRQLLGNRYEPTKVVLFRDSIQSACGYAQAATGPFYCPRDRKVYSTWVLRGAAAALRRVRRLRAGLRARARNRSPRSNLTGTESRVRQGQQSDPRSVNALSVRLELQADCYAGVWGHQAAKSGRAASGGVELDRRRGRSAERGGSDRRRSPAEAWDGTRDAREVHARLVGTARDVVQARLRQRRPAGV